MEPYGSARDEYADWSTTDLWDVVNSGKVCADRDPDDFWGIESEQPPADPRRQAQELAHARRLCTNPRTGATCPVIKQCLTLDDRLTPGSERYGVWGGLPGWARTQRLQVLRRKGA